MQRALANATIDIDSELPSKFHEKTAGRMEFFAQVAFHSNLFRDDVTTHPE